MKRHILSSTMALLQVIGILTFACCQQAQAMDNKIPVHGRLTDAAGNPLNGTYERQGRRYTAAVGGTLLCADTNDVAVVNGLFTMYLGNCTSNDFSGTQQLYLGIQVGSDAEMSPRQPLYGVPFAHGLVNGVLQQRGGHLPVRSGFRPGQKQKHRQYPY